MRGVFGQGHRCEIQQPRAYYAAAPPDFGKISKIQIVAVIFRQLFAAGITADIKALRVSLHNAVLDSVVNHLYEMARPRSAATNISAFRGSAPLLASPGGGN